MLSLIRTYGTYYGFRIFGSRYFMHGIVDEKTDVFAYGVLLLEIITGRHAVDSSRQSLAMWAKPLLQENNAKEVADPRLREDYDPIEMKRAMLTASEFNREPGMKFFLPVN
ncbi:receptor-like cytosolic serine/threonine-protein kinase RBK1 [Hevea brasiliensis]|uniref:receptor-like cytosolic serine/threonine-protein kinase RBK1 n=1 Tax=Hevea brasiliensis TaxID=3981 RepID=UPI0025DFEFE3|nr:receptor-like cytosolic serine/threonine-protein kinase RBK1 [Hevea brasiliensis]